MICARGHSTDLPQSQARPIIRASDKAVYKIEIQGSGSKCSMIGALFVMVVVMHVLERNVSTE